MRRLISAMQEDHVASKIADIQSPEEIPFAPSLREPMEFTDSYGNAFALQPGLREEIKPGWRAMFDAKDFIRIPESEEIDGRVSAAEASVKAFISHLVAMGYTCANQDMLEIGCFDGSRTYALAQTGGRSVVGSDLSRYYVAQFDGAKVTHKEISQTEYELSILRNAIRKGFESNIAEPGWTERVSFIEDDIAASSISDASFDVIVSWEVLEHVLNPETMFTRLYSLLRPGGITFHEYNPFFALNGGHSLCTLDMLWGHAWLSDMDFQRYVQSVRPNEADVAIRFFTENLNRMTLADLRTFGRNAGLELISFIPWNSRRAAELINNDVIRQAKNLYSSVTVEDFLVDTVWVAWRKPPS